MITIDENMKAVIVAIVVIIGGFFALTAEQQTSMVTIVIAVVSFVAAYWQNRQKTNVIAAMIPDTPQALNPKIIASLPPATWKMSEAVKRWLTFDCPAESKESILSQIAAAEAQNLVKYRVNYHGGWYDVEYGALMGDSGNCGKA